MLETPVNGFIPVEEPELPSDPNNEDFTIGGNVSFSSNLDVLGSVGIGSTLDVGGDVSFGSNLQVTGISTFTNGPVIIGSSSSTGSSNQNLQVTGGGYISGAFGIGVTNPGTCGELEIIGTVCATDFNSTSDISLKTNLQKISDPLSKIIELNGYTFDWKKTNKSSVGVVAQELEKVFPELVTGFQPKSVNYNGIIAVLIESIKELNQKVEDLTDEVSRLKMDR